MQKFELNYCSQKIVSNLQVIHYGSSYFQKDKFNPIRNNKSKAIQKPNGGLWVSPCNDLPSWQEWCITSNCNLDKLTSSFCLKFYDFARIALIDSYEDLEKLPLRSKPKQEWETDVDWELISKFADAVWMTELGCKATRLTKPFNLTNWCCESILITNSKSFY
jgi:hypothetical protein